MKIEDLIPVLVIVVGIVSWIIKNVLAAKKQNEAETQLRLVQRPDRQPPERGRKVDAETERFLEEIKRRRRQAADRDPPKPAKPAEKKASAPDAKAAKAARPTVANRKAPGSKQLGKMAAAAAAPQQPAPTSPSPQVAHIAPVVNTFDSFIPSPALKQVAGLLRTKATLQTAFILREVFDRPLSRRRSGRHGGGPR